MTLKLLDTTLSEKCILNQSPFVGEERGKRGKRFVCLFVYTELSFLFLRGKDPGLWMTGLETRGKIL